MKIMTKSQMQLNLGIIKDEHFGALDMIFGIAIDDDNLDDQGQYILMNIMYKTMNNMSMMEGEAIWLTEYAKQMMIIQYEQQMYSMKQVIEKKYSTINDEQTEELELMGQVLVDLSKLIKAIHPVIF